MQWLKTPRWLTPFMVNLDGFALTHTYETVDVPAEEDADAFLPPYQATNCFDFEHPKNIGYSAGPDYNRYFKYYEHRDMLGRVRSDRSRGSAFCGLFRPSVYGSC